MVTNSRPFESETALELLGQEGRDPYGQVLKRPLKNSVVSFNACVVMLGIGFFEIIIIAIVCFIAIGPKQLPAVMRKLAHFYRQFIALRDEFRFQIMSADDVVEQKLASPQKPEKTADEIVVVPRDQNHG